MDPDNQGQIVYRSLLGACPLIASMHIENGAVAMASGAARGPSRYEGVMAAGAMWRPSQCQ